MLKQILFSTALMVSTAALAQTPSPGGSMSPGGAPAPSATPAPAAPNPAAPGNAMTPSIAGGMASTAKSDLSAADRKFIDKLASANQAEIQAAQLAQQKSSDQHVKDIAQQILTDHTAAGQKLTALAEQKGVKVPPDLAPADQKEIDKFSKLDGKKFDRAYLKAEAKDHKTVLAELKKESASGKDADVKALADELAPTIQKHLDMLENKAS